MPLSIAPKNTNLKIIKITADDSVKKHLESLGISINSNIMVISNSSGIVCKILESHLALDAEMGRRIQVIPA